MGINCGNLILLKAYTDTGAAAPLGDTLMFGRLTNTLSESEQRRVARRQRIPATVLADKQTESLLRAVGATKVQSLDISDYEGCDLVFDLTRDIAESDLAARTLERFDTILDYGTSEHVFNAPQALVNAWNMLRDGGRYIFDLPVTGWSSHGLYQFSPNYFYSIGRTDYFRLEHMFFHEKRGDRIYSIPSFDNAAYKRVNGARKISAWGVLKKLRPAGMQGPLKLADLRVVQEDIRLAHGDAPRPRNRTFGLGDIAAGFTTKS